MDLKDFITTSIVQVMEGVNNAKEHAVKLGAKINPETIEFRADAGQDRMWDTDTGKIATELKFDISVIAVDSTDKDIKGGLKVLGLGLEFGSGAKNKAENQTINKLQFAVPLVLP
jgi:anti-sigma regulatory factor (Ser/Thr protein kinase)